MVTGASVTYVAGNGHRPLPMATDATYRKAHAPQPKKPAGLDWDALTPKCKECGTKSGQLDNSDTCPSCRGVEPSRAPTTKAAGYASVQQSAAELESRFTAPTTAPAPAPTEPPTEKRPARHPAGDEVERGSANVAPTQLPHTPEEGTPAHADEGVVAAAGPQEATPEPERDDEDHTPAYLRRLQAARAEIQPTDPITDPTAADLDEATVTAWSAKDEIDDVEREIPEIVEAAAAYDEMLDQIRHPHVDAPAPAVKPDPIPGALEAANRDAQIAHAQRTLRDTADATDPVTRLLRLNVLSAIESLYLYTQLHPQTAASATSTPAGAAPTPPSPSPGLGGDRPAAASGGEAHRQPANPMRRPSRLDPHRDELIKAYADGASPSELGARYGVSDVSIRHYLKREGVQLRTRAEAQVLARAANRTTPTGDTAA